MTAGQLIVMLAWSLPAIALLTMAAGMGAAWIRTARGRPGATRLLIVQITTRGDGRAANEVIDRLSRIPGRIPREVWVVVDEGDTADYPGAERVVEVPNGFRCRAKAKGRALEWARLVRASEGLAGDDVAVLLLDDDSVPTDRYLRLCEDTDADIAQGIVAPRRHYAGLLSHLDDLRTLNCLAVCSWSQARGKPVHVHGEGLRLRSSVEQAIGWDASGSELAEDLAFGQRASARGLRWAFLPAVVEITSPWTYRAFLTQRRRWTWGTIKACAHVPPGARLRIGAFYVITLGGSCASLAGTVTSIVSGRAHAGPWAASLAAWLALFAIAGWINSRGRPIHSLAAACLAWLTGLVNFLVVPVSVLLGPPARFRTIPKLEPDGGTPSRRRAYRSLRVGAAGIPGLLLIGFVAFAAATQRGGEAPERSWAADVDGHALARVDRSGERRRTPSIPSEPDLTRAMTVIAYGNDPFFVHKSKRLLDRLARLGVTHVSLTVPIFTQGVSSDSVFADPKLTPNPERIEAFSALAHERGMTAGLNPLLDEQSLIPTGDWRGSLAPADRERWFRSYAELSGHLAHVAARGDYQSYTVGTELESLAADSGWQRVLRAIEASFDGETIYAMAGSRVLDLRIPWVVTQVDLVGVNAWYSADLPVGASSGEINAALGTWRGAIRRFADAASKPIVFSEAGSPSQAGAYTSPALVRDGVAVDPGAQLESYEATCDLARQVGSKGIIWWATTLDPPADPGHDPGFDPLGKAAEDEIGDCRFGGGPKPATSASR